MAEVIKSIEVPVGANVVWPLISDFGGMDFGPDIKIFEVQGEGEGMVRKVGTADAVAYERLDWLDNDAMIITYTMMNDDSHLPVKKYRGRFDVTSIDDNSCRIDWYVSFIPRGDEADAVAQVEGMWTRGLVLLGLQG